MKHALAAGFLLLASLSARAEDAPPAPPAVSEPAAATYTVLRIARGDDVDVKALAAKEVTDFALRTTANAQKEIDAWTARDKAFRADPANRGKVLRDLKPVPALVTVLKDGLSEQEAKHLAEDEQKKANETYAVVRTTLTDGSSKIEILRQANVPGKLVTLLKEFDEQTEGWNARREDFARVHKHGNKVFDEPKPSTPKVEVLKGQIAGKAAAEAARKDLTKPEPPKK